MPTRHQTRTAGREDAAAVQRVLARAFQDDPAMGHIWPDADERRRRLPGFFRSVWHGDLAGHGTVLMTAGGEAATLWLPPGHPKSSTWSVLVRLPSLWRLFGGGLGRAMACNAALEARHPAYPHHYLHFAACAPEHQGKGHGGAAIRAGLARADADGLPCWLETATLANVPLYRALGFDVRAEWSVSGLRFWGMERPAAGPARNA